MRNVEPDRSVILTVYSSVCAEPQLQDKELKQAFIFHGSCAFSGLWIK